MKRLKMMWEACTTVLLICVALLAVLLVGVRLIGLEPYVVLSGSMEPAYRVGSLLYVKATPPSEIQIGDPITYSVSTFEPVVTHRVVAIEIVQTIQTPMLDENNQPLNDADGNAIYIDSALKEPMYYFTTKGDANAYIDAEPVYHENVQGVPVFSLPYLGYFAHWLQMPQGRILGVSMALAVAILCFLPDLLRMVCKRQAGTNEV